MYEIGRLTIKTAGRDAGKRAVVINILDNNYVMIDGETRRRKCNISHLEPLDKVIKINKNASHEDVKKEFKRLGLKVRDTKPKEKKERPKKVRKKKIVEAKEEKPKKKALFTIGEKKKEQKNKKIEKKVETKKVEKKIK